MAMEGNTGLSASDIALMTGNNGNFGNNGMMWIFALLLLAGGGFGGWGNGNFANAIGYENLATSNEVQRGFDNQNSMANQREILAAVTNGTAQSVAASNQVYHDLHDTVYDKYGEISRDVAALQVSIQQLLANQNECCGSTKMLIMEQSQKLHDEMAQNKIEALQAQVNQLQLAQATNGMLKFPNQWSYGAGAFPPIFGQCGGCNNI